MANDKSPFNGPISKAFEGLGAGVFDHLGPLAGSAPIRPLAEALSSPPAIMSAIEDFDFEPDDSPQRTAENTEAMTAHLAALTAVMREQAALVAEQVALSKETLRTAEQAEKRANRIGWSSLAIAVISLGTSIAALFIAR